MKPVIRCTSVGIFICQDVPLSVRINPLRGFGMSIESAYYDWQKKTGFECIQTWSDWIDWMLPFNINGAEK